MLYSNIRPTLEPWLSYNLVKTYYKAFPGIDFETYQRTYSGLTYLTAYPKSTLKLSTLEHTLGPTL